MTSVSARMAIGGTACMEVLLPFSFLKEALSEQIPSWATEVGMLMKGMPVSLETILQMSILLPPPTARMNLASDFFTASMTLSTLSWVVLPTNTADMS